MERNDVSDFLTSRRANVTPERAGLPAYGGHRRVPGLRREEVAMLAGVSVDYYYTRMERGNLRGVSDSVLDSLASALQLDETEQAHLRDLAGTGVKDVHHPIVGDLHLSFEAMELPSDPGLSLIVYSSEAGSSTADGLALLATWAATVDQTADATSTPAGAPADRL